MITSDGTLTVLIAVRRPRDRHPRSAPQQLHDAVRAGATHVVADVSQVERLSSDLLASLLFAHRCCRARGGHVTVRGGSRSVLDLLRRTRLDLVFVVEPAPGPVTPPTVPSGDEP